MGIEGPMFEDDSGPKSLKGNLEHDDPDDIMFPKDGNSLDRAELMVGSLLDAAVYLTSTIHNYKIVEIKARINEISSEMHAGGTPDMKAIDKIVDLKKMLEQLEKEVRRSFPQWRIKAK